MNQIYDFAFSFAGEDRKIVNAIKEEMMEFNIFYDSDYQLELCGMDLYQYLRDIYMNKATYVVCFLSKNYRQKVWTNTEMSAIKERLMATFFASDFLIPIVLDEEMLLDDIPSFIGYYKYETINKTAQLLKAKYYHTSNEDYYLESIVSFGEYLLKALVANFPPGKLQKGENPFTITEIISGKSFRLVPEKFTKLQSLLFYEDNDLENPVAIITWKRDSRIWFKWECLSDFRQTENNYISLNELVKKMRIYIQSKVKI